MTETTAGERVAALVKALGTTNRAFEKATGWSNGSVGNTGNNLSPDKVLKACKVYPQINRDWLLFGEGDMFVEEYGFTAVPPSDNSLIRYYPEVTATMGIVDSLPNPNESFIEMSIPGYGGTIAINAEGDSMAPLIKSGWIVLLTECKGAADIQWGEIYAIITKSGMRCIKYIIAHTDPTKIIGRSHDQARFGDMEIDLADVVRIYKVRGWVAKA